MLCSRGGPQVKTEPGGSQKLTVLCQSDDEGVCYTSSKSFVQDGSLPYPSTNNIS